MGLRRDATPVPMQGSEWQGAALPVAPNSNPRLPRAIAYCRPKMVLTMGSTLGTSDYLMRLSLGSRIWEESPDPINVLTFVDCVHKTVEGFRQQYDSLSEYSHPNYSGTTGLYSKNDTENILTDFGSNVRNTDGPKHIGVINLSVALMMFHHTYNKLADVMSDFVALSEKNLPS